MVDHYSKGYLRNSQLIGFICKAADSFIIFISLALPISLYLPGGWSNIYALLGFISILLFLLVAEIGHLYRSWRGVPFYSEFLRLTLVWIAVTLILMYVGYALKVTSDYSRVVITSWILLVPLLLGLLRLVGRYHLGRLRAQGYNTRQVAVVGAGELGVKLINTITSSPEMGLNIIGLYDDRTAADKRTHVEASVSGDCSELIAHAKSNKIDLIYIALPLSAQHRIAELIDQLADTTASVYLVPDFFISNLFHGNWSNLDGIPIVSVFDTPFWGVDGWLKRFQDVVLASLILALIALPMVLIAAAVKLTSPGPVLFKQRRYGMDGKEMYVWKFRSMTVQDDGDQIEQATRNDPRITPFGAFIRRTSLDELPQFFNVLTGQMSVVGPRPHAVAHNEEYREQIKGYMLRHVVKPGITGWAQINGWRGETDTLYKMEKRIEHDLWYIRNWSFWLDLKIVFLTMIKGFTGKHAY